MYSPSFIHVMIIQPFDASRNVMIFTLFSNLEKRVCFNEVNFVLFFFRGGERVEKIH